MVKDLMVTIKSDTTDKQLIEAVKRHNQKAFTAIHNRYAKDVRKHLLYKTSNNKYLESIIDDVVSETFIALWENIVNDKYEAQGFLKAYLQKIAWFKLCKITKNPKPTDNDKIISDEANEEELGGIFKEDVIDYKTIAEEALKKLNEICLQLINLKYYDKLSDTEIQRKFESEISSVRNVRSKRSHCMDKLREESDKILKNIK